MLNVQDFGLNLCSFVKIQSRGHHFLERATAIPVFTTYCLQLMLRGQYRSSPLTDAKPSDPSYNILHMLPPPKHNQAYQQLLTENLEVMQQTILDQSKKKKADTFMGGVLTSFDHVLAALANDDMFTCFRICFKEDRRILLQVRLYVP